MPSIYLSPSTQEWNTYVTGGSEEYYMNLLADALEPYLHANAIQFTRNTPDMTAATSIQASNSGNYDLHLALHSNAAPEGRYGTVRGSEAYYYPGSENGQRFADIFIENMREIYPIPDRVRAIPTTTIGEVRRTNAPSVLLEIAYHDNEEDATWIVNNIDAIAQVIARSLAEYFGTPFVWPTPARVGTVTLSNGGSLNIRSQPDTSAPIIGSAQDGDTLTIFGQIGDWYSVQYGDTLGFASMQYIR